MADSTVTENGLDTAAPIISKSEIISNLEDRYVKLLEAKIQSLEAQLGAQRLVLGPLSEIKSKTVSYVASDDNDSDVANEQNEFQAAKDIFVEEEKETRYAMIISRWDSLTGEYRDETQHIDDEAQFGPEKESKLAFTFRKILNKRRTGEDYSSSEVTILFPPLQKLLGRLTLRWGWPKEVKQCRSPYSALIYSWDEAQEAASAIVDEDDEGERQARNDLKELLKIIATSSSEVQLDRYLKNRQTLLAEATITHEALWTLFPPGTLIVGKPCRDEPQLFFVDSCDGFVSDDETFELVCYSFDWNGTDFNRIPFGMEVEEWGRDRKKISELPFYPLAFHEEEGLSRDKAIEKLKEYLVKRGTDYRAFCIAQKGSQMFNYTEGAAYFHRSGAFLQRQVSELETHRSESSSLSVSSGDHDSAKIAEASWMSITGPMIVDFASYLTYSPPRAPILGHLRPFEGSISTLSPERRSKKVFQDIYRFHWDGHAPLKAMSEEQLMCCPPRVLGYALKQKTWVQLLVRYLRKPDGADEKTFQDKLQLDPDTKELLSKSVRAHEKGKKRGANGKLKWLQDFTPEKGKGLVIMLYGLPGVGKTLAAESVAQMTGKPLLSIGVSDIGIEGDKVELNLQKVFALAGAWEAVLLFDEADVFLDARGEGENDIRRNAMVSVLLRILEYYDGVLILTTNRMRSIDIAVQSRIQLAIKFNDLSPSQKTCIYESFLEQLHEKHLVASFEGAMRWVHDEGKRFDFNGRQIRNVVSTALGIALADGDKLDRLHLANVARETDRFKRDLAYQEAIYKDRHINPRN